jgi:hypothetical protein
VGRATTRQHRRDHPAARAGHDGDRQNPPHHPDDGRPHTSASATFWRGNPRGRWDGNTLVVDVTGLNGRHWFDSVGNFYTEHTHMVERLTMVDPNTIDYELAVEDPTSPTWPACTGSGSSGSEA